MEEEGSDDERGSEVVVQRAGVVMRARCAAGLVEVTAFVVFPEEGFVYSEFDVRSVVEVL